MLRTAVLAGQLLVVGLASPLAQEPPGEPVNLAVLRSHVAEHLESLAERPGFPGTSVAFVLPDGRLGAVTHGRASAELAPLTTADRLMSGSIGKTYAAAVALQLVADELLDLDAAVLELLQGEDWARSLPNADALTVRSLMNHTSGIPEHVRMSTFQEALLVDPDRRWTPAELLAFVLDTEPLFPVGEGWSYADTNYIVLGVILEQLGEAPYYEQLRERVLDPLELLDTVPTDRRIVPGLAAGVSDGGLLRRAPGPVLDEQGRYPVDPQFEWCGGGLASTTSDLARWCQAWATGAAFPAELLPQVRDGVAAATGPGDRYGLGCQILASPHGTSYGHSGFMPGYLSIMSHYPRFALSVAVQHDSDELRRIGRGLRTTADEIAGILIEHAGLPRTIESSPRRR